MGMEIREVSAGEWDSYLAELARTADEITIREPGGQMRSMPLPGWYTDPSGRAEYRWWDGLKWTSHAAAGGRQWDEARPR